MYTTTKQQTTPFNLLAFRLVFLFKHFVAFFYFFPAARASPVSRPSSSAARRRTRTALRRSFLFLARAAFLLLFPLFFLLGRRTGTWRAEDDGLAGTATRLVQRRVVQVAW